MTPTLDIDKTNWKKYWFDELCCGILVASRWGGVLANFGIKIKQALFFSLFLFPNRINQI